MRKLTKKEVTALHKLSAAETTFMKCVDVIAENLPVDDKEAFYFSALSSLSYILTQKLQEDDTSVLARVYANIMRFKKEGFNNERFN